MKARTLALVITAAVLVYLALVAMRGIAFIRTGDPVAVGLGAAVLVLPVLGVGVAARELAFGRDTQRLMARLSDEGGLPVVDLPRRPSGRPVREAADAVAAERIAEVEGAPQDWRAWLRLALAYDDAGDRRRARAAMRSAITLERTDDRGT